MTGRKGEVRVYPTCCQSAYCGRGSCDGCRNLPVLTEWKAWRDATGAIAEDHIWCPSVYTAQHDAPREVK